MRILRFILVLSLCAAVLANAARFFVRPGDRRVDEATIRDATQSTTETRLELSDAIAGAHRRLIMEEAVFGAVFVCLSAGILFTTKATRGANADRNLRG